MHSTLLRIGSAAPFHKAMVELLTDEQATPNNILAALDRAVAASAPDDWLVVFLAGHGFCLRGKPGRIDGVGEVNPGSWFFAAYARSESEPLRVEARELFARLALARCRKLVLLDSCHSGAAIGADGARDLRQDGKGAIILTAAAPEELAGEAFVDLPIDGRIQRARHGYFTTALYAALGGAWHTADRNQDRLLTVDELYEFTRLEVLRLRTDGGQTVTMSPFPVRNLGFLGTGTSDPPLVKPAPKPGE
jgi:hypothetical protein